MHSQKSLSAQTRRKKLVYIRNNWQLYIFFALPAVLLYQAAWTVLQLAVPLGKAS